MFSLNNSDVRSATVFCERQSLRNNASADVVAMCNCLVTEDSCRPAFRILERKQFSYIFCVNYSKQSMKHADLQSIFTTALPIDETAIRCTEAYNKRMSSKPHSIKRQNSRLIVPNKETKGAILFEISCEVLQERRDFTSCEGSTCY